MNNIIGFVAIILAMAFAVDVSGQENVLVADGARVYGNTCGSCHNARSPIERSDQEWVTVVNHMRVRANLTGQQSRAVLAFQQASNGSPYAENPPPPDEFSNAVSTDARLVEQGRALIAAKACIGCHVVAGVGGNIGPDLDGVVSNKGARFVRQKIVMPSFDNPASLMPSLGLTPEEVDALVAYLATISGALPDGNRP